MLRKTLRALVRCYRVIEIGCTEIAAGFILLLMFLNTSDVIGRYVFNSPIQGALEASEIMLIGIAFLGVAYVQSLKGHVRVDIATAHMSRRGQLAIDVFAYTLCFLIAALMIWQTSIVAWKAWALQEHTMGIVRIPLWPARMIVPFGIGMLCLRFISDLVNTISHLRRGATE